MEVAFRRGARSLSHTGPRTFLPASAGSSYQGPGDIITFTAWYGLRGYSNAKAIAGTTKAIRVVDSGGLNAQDILILTNGQLDNATLNTWIVAHGTASITTWYDQTGSGWDVTQGTVASMPTIVQNILNSSTLPVANFNGSQVLSSAVFTPTLTQPYTLCQLCLSSALASFIGVHDQNGLNDNPVYIEQGVGGSLVEFYAGSDQSFITCSQNHYHQSFGVPNGASATLAVDGAAMSAGSGTGNSGSNNIGGGGSRQVWVGSDSFVTFATGRNVECGFAAGNQSASNVALWNNIIGFYGTLP